MNRRQFLKQATVITIGVAAATKLPPVTNTIPEVVGVDVARPSSEDFSAVSIIWQDEGMWHLESLTIPDEPPFNNFWELYIRNMALVLGSTPAVIEEALMQPEGGFIEVARGI